MNVSVNSLSGDAICAATAPVRVFLVEPNPLVVQARGLCFKADPRFVLTDTTDSARTLLAAPCDAFDVAVVSWASADLGAVEVLREWRARRRAEPVTVFSNNRDLGCVRQSVRLVA